MVRARLHQTEQIFKEDQIDLGTCVGRQRFVRELKVADDPLMVEVPCPFQEELALSTPLLCRIACESFQTEFRRHLQVCHQCNLHPDPQVCEIPEMGNDQILTINRPALDNFSDSEHEDFDFTVTKSVKRPIEDDKFRFAEERRQTFHRVGGFIRDQ